MQYILRLPETVLLLMLDYTTCDSAQLIDIRSQYNGYGAMSPMCILLRCDLKFTWDLSFCAPHMKGAHTPCCAVTTASIFLPSIELTQQCGN